eukprot:8925795-Pyramimonas_sp.AAC.2
MLSHLFSLANSVLPSMFYGPATCPFSYEEVQSGARVRHGHVVSANIWRKNRILQWQSGLTRA